MESNRALDENQARSYKTFMLNSAEHEMFSANKYENANNSWHFHIYQQRNYIVGIFIFISREIFTFSYV